MADSGQAKLGFAGLLQGAAALHMVRLDLRSCEEVVRRADLTEPVSERTSGVGAYHLLRSQRSSHVAGRASAHAETHRSCLLGRRRLGRARRAHGTQSDVLGGTRLGGRREQGNFGQNQLGQIQGEMWPSSRSPFLQQAPFSLAARCVAQCTFRNEGGANLECRPQDSPNRDGVLTLQTETTPCVHSVSAS